MSSSFYKLPLELQNVMEGRDLPGCNLEYSITRNLELIINTRFGEHRSDPTFGCEIWDLDFELIVSAAIWEERFRKSLVKSVQTHEPRLADPELSVAITDTGKLNLFKQYTEIKKRVDISMIATVRSTGEPFHFKTSLYLSPLSIE